MEEASGRDLATFFDQWLHRGGALEIEATWTWDKSRGVLTVTIHQTQPNALPYRTPLELQVTNSEGLSETFVLDLEELSERFEFELEQEPASIALDPELKVLSRTTLERR